ncbi:MAG: hypothetical protein JRH20_24415, partial [Deltaproteobacteria bacterium]|nr:hypothetical protein [Deltaproteobacteria bacterium]
MNVARSHLMMACGLSMLLLSSSCADKAKPTKQQDASSTKALQQLRARYPNAKIAPFKTYSFATLTLFSVAPRAVTERCAQRWIVAMGPKGRILAKAELLRELFKEPNKRSAKAQARLCQDMLLDQLGNGSIDVQTVAKACRTKPPLDYCDDGTRAMIV